MLRPQPRPPLFPYTTLFRSMKELGLRPRRTVRVVFWTNEENGARGAQAYADSLGKKEHHVAAVESEDRKSTRLNSSHANISYAVFCLKKKKQPPTAQDAPPQ